jgi:hypothetical protein
VPTVTKVANYTIDPATDFMVFCNAASTGNTGVTITLPAAASNTGRMFSVKRINANNATQDRCFVTPVATAASNIMRLDAPDATSTNTNSGITLISDGTNWWILTTGP